VGYAVLWWNQYRYFADTVALSEHYTGVKAFAETLIARAGGGGTTAGMLNHSTSTHGDWVSVANRSKGATTCSGRAALDHHANATCCLFMECPDAVVNGFYYVTLFRILAAAAGVLRHTVDATRYQALAKDAVASLAAAEYNSSRHVMGYGYQADQAMAIALGPTDGVLPAGDFTMVAAGLAADVAKQDGHLDTGMFGTKLLLPALSSAGYGDAAIGVLTQTTAPSWGAWIMEHSATTLFEMWGAFDGTTGTTGVASHNHVMFSTFMPWLYQTVVGIAMDDSDFGVGVLPPPPLSPHPLPLPTGFSRFRVAPRLVRGLSFASGEVVTMRGNISVSWSR
jgi:alpha-L-rhamnosidase